LNPQSRRPGFLYGLPGVVGAKMSPGPVERGTYTANSYWLNRLSDFKRQFQPGLASDDL
jgi:hypothetical protein